MVGGFPSVPQPLLSEGSTVNPTSISSVRPLICFSYPCHSAANWQLTEIQIVLEKEIDEVKDKEENDYC